MIERLRGWVGRVADPLLVASGAVLLALLALVLFYNFDFGQKRYEPGVTATETIKSPRALSYKSDLLTREAKDRAAASVAAIYHPKSIFQREEDEKVSSFVTKVTEARGSPSAADKSSSIRSDSGITLSRSSADTLATLSDEDWTQLGKVLARELGNFQSTHELTPESLSAEQSTLTAELSARYGDFGLPENARSAFEEVAGALLLPNHVIDSAATSRLRNDARDRVSPVVTSIDKGEIIFLAGQKITELDVEKLQAVGLAQKSFNIQRFLGELILLALLVGLAVFYFQTFERAERVHRSFALFAVLLLLVAVGLKVLLPIKPIFAYIFPVASYPLLVYLFLRRLGPALLAAVLGSFLAALVAGASFEIFTVQLLGSLAALFASYQVGRISSFVRVAVALGAASFLSSFAFLLLTTGYEARLAWPLLVAAAGGAVLSVFLVIGSAVFLSRTFGITTFIQLLELESPSHPLLADLMFRAPGTYHHSIVMGNMTERAARAVGASPLLARVGVYYHDIGKMLFPQWFIENQERGPNPHDRLKNPEESARHLIAHVTEGERLAREHHLPEEIIHIIRSHHGTMLASYFYEQAKSRSLDPDPEHYRYPGPIPQSKEAGIIMLADGIEAMVRSLDEPTEEAIRDAISSIVEARKQGGQLDECDLTFKDLEIIKAVFADVLLAVHHERVKYPGQADGSHRR